MNDSTVTIVMYHYVRDFQNTKYPNIKGMDVRDFENQIKYIIKNYSVISMEELICAINNKKLLPNNCALFTFDDAYSDHYKYVFPILKKFNIKGTFYIPTDILKDKKVLDVNKIHYILASANTEEIIEELFKLLKKYRKEYNLNSNDYYFKKYTFVNRWDPKEVTFIKRMLQKGLKEKLRNKIANELFIKFVGEEEEDFSKKIYLSTQQILEMQKAEMDFGPHTHDHVWLNTLTKEEQRKQIEKSLEYLKGIGVNLDKWTMCYPFGAYNDETIDLLKELDCSLAVTSEPKVADIIKNDKYRLPRLDCNDIEWG